MKKGFIIKEAINNKGIYSHSSKDNSIGFNVVYHKDFLIVFDTFEEAEKMIKDLNHHCPLKIEYIYISE